MSVLRGASSGIGVIQRENDRVITSFSVFGRLLSRRPARVLLPLLSLIAIVGVLPGSTSSATSPGMVDLGGLGDWGSQAVAVSDSGQVVGNSFISDPFYAGANIDAFSWTQAGGMVDLGGLGDWGSQAVAVSDSGQVVGNSFISDPFYAGANIDAFSWTQAGGMVDLGGLGDWGSQAVAVSDSGQVVGNSFISDPFYAGANIDAFSWTQAGGWSTSAHSAAAVLPRPWR